MTKTAIVYTCTHTDPSVSNERFDWLGEMIYQIKPDYVVDLGDGADMKSLNTYDTRYPQQIVTQSYEKDIQSYNDAQDRLRWKFRHLKKRKPMWIGFEGNHENRIKKAIQHDPRLEGTEYGISFSHLQTDSWFDEYHEYENSGPAIADYDGVSYAHFFTTANSSNAVSGTHHAYQLLQNRAYSSTCGHSHKRSIYFKDGAYPRSIIGAVVGCYKGKEESWAGQSNREWWRGVLVKRNIENGTYDPEWWSYERIKETFGG